MPFPIIPLVTALISGASALKKRKDAKDAETAAEEALKNSPKYAANRSILNYYDEALRKYNVNPTDTREFKATKQGINQGTVQGLRALQDRRSGLAGVPTLVANQNNSLLKAAVNSENRKAQELGVVGQAAGMKAGEESAAFRQNELYPFEGRYNLLTMKAAGARAGQRQDTQNLYNNASAAAGLYDGGDTETMQQNSFGQRYGTQGGSAYNWAKANNMNFGTYRNKANRVGRSLMNFGY